MKPALYWGIRIPPPGPQAPRGADYESPWAIRRRPPISAFLADLTIQRSRRILKHNGNTSEGLITETQFLLQFNYFFVVASAVYNANFAIGSFLHQI